MKMHNKANWLKLSLCAAALGGLMHQASAEPEVVRLDVSAGGEWATPVVLHSDNVKNWLDDSDWFSYGKYSGDGNNQYFRPKIVELTWGDEGRTLAFTNLMVGVRQEWSVTKNDGTVLSGAFTTAADAPRTMLIPVWNDVYLRNVRDMGGWPLKGGKRANQGLIYRGANLDDFFDGAMLGSMSGSNYWSTHADEAAQARAANYLVNVLGVKTDLDFRDVNQNLATSSAGSPYVIKEKGETAAGDTYAFRSEYWQSYFPYGQDDGFTMSPASPTGLRLFIAPSGGADLNHTEQIRRVFQVLGKAENYPVYFHCWIGRDRTGIVAFLINALLGAEEDVLYRDYLMTNFSDVGAMSGSVVDTYIRYLLRGYTSDKAVDFREGYTYGPSLAGHVRAYLEKIGVTTEELSVFTQAMTGETPDQVLARVNEAEAGYVDVSYMNGTTVCASHRVANAAATLPPVTQPTSSGREFDHWSEPVLQADGSYVISVVWKGNYTITFLDPFGNRLGVQTVIEGTNAESLKPAAPAGTVITGWIGDEGLSRVTSDMTVTAVMTGKKGYVGTKGSVVSDPDILARGGDEVRVISGVAQNDYIHYFRSTEAAKTFVNNTGAELAVSYLAVGGGGAGGDAMNTDESLFGAGGGGGGGVAGARATLAAGETWTIAVGAGGTSPNDRYLVRNAAGATSIKSGDTTIVEAPGGGGGGSAASSSRAGARAQSGAAGGGGGTCETDGYYNGASGAFASYTEEATYAANAGANTTKLTFNGTEFKPSLAGGGGGAGGAGHAGKVFETSAEAGRGGRGAYSSITGELMAYGGGGGAGGAVRTILSNAGLANGIMAGAGAAGGGTGGYFNGTANVPAMAGTNGLGGGGGGAQGWGTATTGYVNKTVQGAAGGSGIVIIRYAVANPLPATGGDTITCIETATTKEYVHTFSSVEAAQSFVNISGQPLNVRYLVVGGGGAGGDAHNTDNGDSDNYGAGGGGGGGVLGGALTLATDAKLSVSVGAGGTTPGSRYLERNPGQPSTLLQGETVIASAPAGGGGASNSSVSTSHPGATAQSGAAGGGGGSNKSGSGTNEKGAAGTFASVVDGKVYPKNAGGTAVDLVFGGNTFVSALSGGGGGAGSAGEAGVANPTVRAGNGGEGIPSDITGSVVTYGGGGGAGGVYMQKVVNAGLPDGVGAGEGRGGGGCGGYYADGAFVLPTAGEDGRGGGGGGGVGNGPTAGSAESKTSMGANGGSGVVILRYSVLKEGAEMVLEVPSEGATGAVTFTGSAELDLYGYGKALIKVGTTATLSAVDEAGAQPNAWKNMMTGEVLIGAVQTVTPTVPTEYGALFGVSYSRFTLCALGASGAVTLTADGEGVQSGDDGVFLCDPEITTTVTLSAVDAGGRIVTAWLNGATGEVSNGPTLTVKPTDKATYTALFQTEWIWDTKGYYYGSEFPGKSLLIENSDSEDRWILEGTRKDDALTVTKVLRARSDNFLNLVFSATDTRGQVFSYGGNAYKPAYFVKQIGSDASATGFLSADAPQTKVAFKGQLLVFGKAPADWPEDPETEITDATKPADLGITAGAFATATPAELKKLATWAKANKVPFGGEEVNGLAFADTGYTDFEKAYLLNCAIEEVAEKEAAFKFTAIVPGEVPTIEGDFNGTLTILGAETLEGPWTEADEASHFYKAVLTR